jgi:phosphoglycolate phosphatase
MSLSRTLHLEFPLHTRKPEPATLTRVFQEFKVRRDRTLYVGDSLGRDIVLAQRAGLIDVWARYGRHSDRDGYGELLKITYWTDEDVAFDQKLQLESQKLSPRHSIDRFDEILNICALK